MKTTDVIKKFLDILTRDGDREISSLQIFCGRKNMCFYCENYTNRLKSKNNIVCLDCSKNNGVSYEDFDLIYKED